MAFAGFDRLQYPGNETMSWLRRHTNLFWTGFYLAPAPSQKYTGWMGTYHRLKSMGWGFAPLYVGQQVRGGPGSHDLSHEQGKIDGKGAARLAARAGFPQGSTVFLDIEQGGRLDTDVIAYYRAWVYGLHAHGYQPGVYCSYTSAHQLQRAAASRVRRFWIFNPRFGGDYRTPFPKKNPAHSGFHAAWIWQYVQQGSILGPDNRKITPCDLDTCRIPDPSSGITSG